MNEVDILGTTYTIREETLKDEEIDGFCDYFNRVICIRGDNYNNCLLYTSDAADE